MSGHEAEVVPERELVELFRARRPDADAFRREVDRRIREKEADAPRTDGDPSRDTNSFRAEFVRRAAALFAFDPTGTSAGLGGSLKFVAAVFALPFAMLVASVGAFVAGLRSVGRSAARASEPHAGAQASKPAGMRYAVGSGLAQWMQSAGMVVVLCAVYVCAEWAMDLLALLLLLSTSALVLVVRGLSEWGQLTQRKVERFATMILGGVMFGVFLWAALLDIPDGTSSAGFGWAAGIIAIGLLIFPLVSGRKLGALDAWRSLAFVVLVLVLNPTGVTKSSSGSVRRQLESVRLDAADLANWRDAGGAYAALESAHAALPDMSRVERELDRALEQGLDAHPGMWTSAERMGAVRDDQWERLASRNLQAQHLDQLTAQRGPLQLQGYYSYLVPMWLATRSPTAEQRKELAERIEASWPAADRHDPLDQVVMIVGMLDELGLRERADALRPAVHELLRSSWINESADLYANLGGFTPDAKKFRMSFVPATANAVSLMDRFGAPDGIDLRRVRGNLRSESRAFPLVFELFPRVKLEARAALLRLEEGIGVPPRSWFEALLGERMTIAAILTVLLCVFAIRTAPPDGMMPVRGAMP